ncbi:MAG: hypothetical protein FWD61_01265 [Phycisphaerales bacterium]|nr:hypothetical protein [Phycisphaerales bacterium]
MTKTPQNEQPEAGPLTLTASFQIEAAAGAEVGGATQGGGLPKFRMVAYTGGQMRLAGWRHPVVIDLAGLTIPSQNRPIRFGHDAAAGVGHTDMIRIENGQLIATGVVSRDTAAAKEIVTSGKNGFPWQASIGASVDDFEFVKDGQKTQVNGWLFHGPVNVVRKATLGEISFVDLGADGNTSAKVAASRPQQETNIMETATTVTASETSTTVAPVPAIQAAPTPTAADIRAEALAETNRVATIRKLCAPSAPGGAGGRHFAEIEAKAIAENWDATKTELEVLREGRPKTGAVRGGAPMGFSISGPGAVNQEVLEAACLLSAGIAKPEEHCDEQALEAADKRFRNGIGLQELFLEAARANGYGGYSFRSDPHTIMRMAFASQDQVMAGWSTIDIGGILSNVANKALLEGFFSVERTWRNICAVRSVNDFKTVTSYRLIGTDQYEKVAPGGELKHGTLGNETYTNKADTYGLMLTIDRRDTINDDLGAITTVPRKLGRGSGLKINDVFWTIFLNNAAFFTAANKNLLVGADTILNIDGLTKAETSFMDQVDSDGKPIGIMPAIMLVPTTLSAIGSQLYKSMELRDTTANNKYPIANPHQGKYRVEVSRYLGNSKYIGNSQKAWYLLADPNDLPLIEVAFLNGQESPTIETAEADFNVLGVKMRGYHDFGVALQDPRAGVRSKGEA